LEVRSEMLYRKKEKHGWIEQNTGDNDLAWKHNTSTNCLHVVCSQLELEKQTSNISIVSFLKF